MTIDKETGILKEAFNGITECIGISEAALEFLGQNKTNGQEMKIRMTTGSRLDSGIEAPAEGTRVFDLGSNKAYTASENGKQEDVRDMTKKERLTVGKALLNLLKKARDFLNKIVMKTKRLLAIGAFVALAIPLAHATTGPAVTNEMNIPTPPAIEQMETKETGNTQDAYNIAVQEAINQTTETGMPSIVYSEKDNQFAVVFRDKTTGNIGYEMVDIETAGALVERGAMPFSVDEAQKAIESRTGGTRDDIDISLTDGAAGGPDPNVNQITSSMIFQGGKIVEGSKVNGIELNREELKFANQVYEQLVKEFNESLQGMSSSKIRIERLKFTSNVSIEIGKKVLDKRNEAKGKTQEKNMGMSR